MYNHNEHYLMFCILRSIVLTIQNVCRLDFLQLSTLEALWTVVKTLLHRQKRLLSFKTNSCLCLMINNQLSTTKNILVWWMKRSGHGDYASGDVAKTGDKSSLRGVFAVKRVLNLIRNWLIVFRCKLEFTQMVFDSRFQLCDPWNTAYNRKRKQDHFWIILCWRGIRVRKLFQYNCLHWVLTVLSSSLKLTILYVTCNELFIYHSYRWIDGIRGTHT